MRTAKPSEAPIRICWAIASTAKPESSGITGIGGSDAWAQNAIRNESATRKRIGTPRCANTGSAPNSASTRRNGHSSGVIQARTWVSVKVSISRLLTVLAVGLVVSIFQAATQIHEATLSFVPKVIAAVAVLAFAGPWMLTSLVEYLQRTLQAIPTAVG